MQQPFWFWDCLDFQRLLLRTRILLRAARITIDVHSLPRGKERTKKTRPDVPSGTSLCARANVVSLSLHSCLRENKQIQNLRSHFDEKMRTQKMHAGRKARVFAICNAPCDRENSKQNGAAKIPASANPSAGCDICPADGGILQKQKPRRSSSERREAGRPRRERPSFFLGYFLGNAKK